MAFVLGEVIVCFKSPYWILFALLILIIIIIRKLKIKLLMVIFFSFIAGMILTGAKEEALRAPEELSSTGVVICKGKILNRLIKNEKYYYYLDKAVIVSEEDFNLKIGYRVEFKGSYYPFSESTNPGCFDEKKYYRSLGISYRISASSAKMIETETNILKENLHSVKMKLKDTIYKVAPEKEASLLAGIILGESNEIDKEIKDLYRTSGIAHIIAVSGLHISLIGLGIYRLLRRRFYFISSGICSFILTYGFIIMTGEAASGLRALYMFAIFLAGDILGRTYDSLTSISIAALMLLAKNPFLIFNIGFLLSFSAILSIILMMPVFSKMIKRDSKIFKSLLMSLVAILGTTPILACTFYELSTYSVFINLVILPFVGIIMVSGLLAAILGSVLTKLGVLIASTGLFFLKFNELICRIFSDIPFYGIVVGKMEKWEIVLYYITISLVIILGRFYEKKKLMICVCTGICLLVSLTYIKIPGELEITIIDVGQGDGVLIKCPNNDAYMIDGGSSSEKMVGNYTIVPVIKSRGIGTIRYWFVTHGDIDHNSGLVEILENYKNYNIKIENIVFPDVEGFFIDEEEVLKLAVECGINIIKFKRGSSLRNESIIIKCLHPWEGYSGEDPNGHSLVLSLEYNDFDILFTGDLENDGEEQLIEDGLLKDYDVLKVAHHGSKNSTSKIFLEKISVEFGVISCGRNNIYGHPNYELLKRLEEASVKTFVTKECGAVEIKTNGEKYSVNGYLN